MNETICAISTARGKGGVAVIRISGTEALDVLKRIFVLFTKKDFEPEPRRVYYGSIIRDGVEIDDVTVTYFKAPASYTGEDVCEISCHGGAYVTRAVLEVALSNGARLAEAGEFTKRAYINGKLSLSRAEAVGQIIDAQTDAQLRLSSATRRGTLSRKIDEIKAIMLDLIARAYVIVDYPDEDLPSVERGDMCEKLDKVRGELQALKRTYRTGVAVCEGVKTVIVGRPNVGKSSLYNALCGQELAIVTDIAGTTRDLIEHTVSVGDLTLKLTDTAGIRQTEDTVEKIGVERALEQLDSATLVLCVFDASEEENEQDKELLEKIKQKSAVIIVNKTDKEKKMSPEFEAEIKNSPCRVVYASAKNDQGIDELGRVLGEMYDLDEIDLSSDAVISNARQASGVNNALDIVEEACAFLDMGQSPDIVCFALERALASLEEIDARAVSEEIVNQIFSRFCVGK